MATRSVDHRKRSWNQIVAGSRTESSPTTDVRAALRKEFDRMIADRPAGDSCVLDLFVTWRVPTVLAAAVGVLAAASIFVLRDAPQFLSDPILYLLTNR
jgi:hypothetical protein